MNRIGEVRKLSQEMLATIGPVRWSGAVLTLAQMHGVDGPPTSPEMLASALERLDAAIVLLSEGIARRRAALDLPPRPAIRKLREELLAELMTLRGHVGTRADRLHETLAQAPDLSELCLVTIDARVDAYLDAMAVDVDATVQDLVEADRSEMSDTLQRLHRVGTSMELISINAGIEAARSGTSGAGFLVIAQEMQRLSGEMGGFVTTMRGRVASR